jgi:hypothetical protein
MPPTSESTSSDNSELKGPSPTPPTIPATRDLFVRGIPRELWERLHINAIQSGLRLKNYVIRTLEHAQPFPPE